MDFDVWLAFATASLVLVAIPGPTVMLVISYALTQGRRVAIATALGVALGDFIAVSLSLLGLGALLLTSAWAFSALKWVGAAYLVFLGIKLLRARPHLSGTENPGATPARRVFFHAALVTALNPKGILFFLAFVPQFLNAHAPVAPQFATMLATFVGIGALNALAYALLADRIRQRIRRPAVLAWMNRAGGTALITMGVITATMRRA
jgi:threonine/homoserine/homoserine lactone efflux protein